MPTHATKAGDLAEKITQKAADALDTLEREMIIMKWPAEFRAIMWSAVAQTATIRAVEAERDHKRSTSEN